MPLTTDGMTKIVLCSLMPQAQIDGVTNTERIGFTRVRSYLYSSPSDKKPLSIDYSTDVSSSAPDPGSFSTFNPSPVTSPTVGQVFIDYGTIPSSADILRKIQFVTRIQEHDVGVLQDSTWRVLFNVRTPDIDLSLGDLKVLITIRIRRG